MRAVAPNARRAAPRDHGQSFAELRVIANVYARDLNRKTEPLEAGSSLNWSSVQYLLDP
jgi:hypothetical protein